jgi:4'-phosphopantetheinyl transferase
LSHPAGAGEKRAVSTAVLGASVAELTRASASPDRVDVWQVVLDPSANAEAWPTLGKLEREHAARLRVGAAQWAGARAALRRVLARYLGIAPGEVAMESGANGKPRLAPGAGADLRFNLSHSGNLALIAVRLGHEVGIDLEEVRPEVDGAAIAREVIPHHEASAMAAPVSGVHFFRTWVRREALMKATGQGVVSPPTADATARFQVRDLDCATGFVAALASEGAAWRPVAGE